MSSSYSVLAVPLPKPGASIFPETVFFIAAVVLGITSVGNFTVFSQAGWLKLSERTMTTLVLSMVAVRPLFIAAALAW